MPSQSLQLIQNREEESWGVKLLGGVGRGRERERESRLLEDARRREVKGYCLDFIDESGAYKYKYK